MKLTEESVVQFLQNADKAMDKIEIGKGMHVKMNDRPALRAILARLLMSGKIMEGKKGRFSITQKVSTPQKAGAPKGKNLTGVLRFNGRSFAWLYLDEKLDNQDRLRIETEQCSTALDGDRVMVSISYGRPKFPKRGQAPEPPAMKVKVEKILSRRSGKLVGIFRKKGKFSWVDVEDVAVTGSIEIAGDSTAQEGQLVVITLETWQDEKQTPHGRVVEVLGFPGDAGVDIASVIHRHGLKTSFSDEILQEAHATSETIAESEIKRRKDWRKQLVMTIDPADAKDHDDAIWVEKTNQGWQLAVHIADVSHYVKPSMAMDKEAAERGNSTYLVDRVLPMLPPELSNGICSLKPDVDRLTKCVLMEVNERGDVVSAKFFDSVIYSRAKLAYETAQEILDGKNAADPEVNAMVREAWNMASLMRKRRFEKGSLDLEFPEYKVLLDEKGKAKSVYEVIHTASHQLIEECMLAANEAVAHALKKRAKPTAYRVHENPDPERLSDFTEVARSFGYQPGDLTNRNHVQKLLNAAKGNSDEHVIKLGLLKSLKRAAYDTDPLGHYGLAKNDYCHFTSPIRRYADLLVHRAVQHLIENKPEHFDKTPPLAELKQIVAHISDTERESAAAESETRQIKLMEWLTLNIDNPEAEALDGMITEARPMGLFVEIISVGIKGVVKREDLPDARNTDWFFDSTRQTWTSRRGQQFRNGQAVKLKVKAIDHMKKFVDFIIPSEQKPFKSDKVSSSKRVYGKKKPPSKFNKN